MVSLPHNVHALSVHSSHQCICPEHAGAEALKAASTWKHTLTAVIHVQESENAAADSLAADLQSWDIAGVAAPSASDRLPGIVADRNLDDLLAAQDAWTMTK